MAQHGKVLGNLTAKVFIMTKKEQIEWYKTFSTFRKSRIKAWSPKIYKALINIIKSAITETSVSSAITQLDRNIQITELATLIQKIYVDAGAVLGARAYQLVKKQGEQKRLLPIGYNEELVNEIIQYFQINLLSKAVLPISQTMKEWIYEKLVEAQQQGKSLTDVAEEIVKHDFPKNRAIMIARTETIKASNYGAVQGAKKAGYKTSKIWIAAKDNRTRRVPRDEFNHLSMNGVTVDIDEWFHVPRKLGGYDRLQQPGDPNGEGGDVINCRCTVGFKVQRGENGLPIRL